MGLPNATMDIQLRRWVQQWEIISFEMFTIRRKMKETHPGFGEQKEIILNLKMS